MRPIKRMQTVHHELMHSRAQARKSTHTWGVFGINKDGRIAKLPSVTMPSQDEAVKRAAAMSAMNNGKQFVAKEV